MTVRIAAVVGSLAILFAGLLLRPGPVAGATGPYTLPFFDPKVAVTQPYGCTGVSSEPAYGSCAHWHAGIDYGLWYAPVAAARAGKVAAMLEAVAADNHSDPRGGNYVLVEHSSSRFTLYYHLQNNGVYSAGIGATVSAGQNIALSGNTGVSSAPHLHYALLTARDWWLAANAINPNGTWTTDPGRVPWLAVYSSESNGGTEYITQGTTVAHWVKFRNAGGRTWTAGNDGYGRGRIMLAATTSNGGATRNSAFQAADWSSAWLASGPEQSSIPPDGIGTFTFGLKATPPVGWYTEYFNLRANALWWFDYATLGGYYVPIRVTSSGCATCA
ncbi:MAG: M23 family metallopeptidase [Candidatus Limnocylindria bacterium]